MLKLTARGGTTRPPPGLTAAPAAPDAARLNHEDPLQHRLRARDTDLLGLRRRNVAPDRLVDQPLHGSADAGRLHRLHGPADGGADRTGADALRAGRSRQEELPGRSAACRRGPPLL